MGGGDAHKTPEGRIFVGGHWRDEQEWPLARDRSRRPTTCTRTASCRRTNQRTIRPSPTYSIRGTRYRRWAEMFPLKETLMFQGAADQRCRPDFWLCSDTKPLSARNDVLVFQTPPLSKRHRGHRPPHRETVGVLERARYRFHGQADRRLPAQRRLSRPVWISISPTASCARVTATVSARPSS